jgi:dynactin 1
MCEQKACELERALESLRNFQEQKQQTSVELSSVAVDDSNPCMEDQQSQRQDNADKQDLQRQLSEALTNIQTLQQEAFEGKAKHVAETLATERESQIVKEQFERKSSNAADYLKERAKLTAEISTLHRRVSDLQAAASEYETSVEGLVLDKEALLEEKEELLDQLEEKTLEIATLQIELEEVKVELEEGKAAFEKCNKGHSIMTLAEPSVKVVDENGVEESSKALSSQNSRLREALLRLREQTNIENLELTKQLRLAEKDVVAGRGLMEELESLRNLKVKNASEIRDLKETVDTQNVYGLM